MAAARGGGLSLAARRSGDRPPYRGGGRLVEVARVETEKERVQPLLLTHPLRQRGEDDPARRVVHFRADAQSLVGAQLHHLAPMELPERGGGVIHA